MFSATASTLPRIAIVVFAACTATLASPQVSADSPPSTIYRCKQQDGGLAYQDFPCAGGVVVEIRPGSANPDAIARLAREQEAYERAAAMRRADELAALRRQELTLRQRELDYAAAGAGSTAGDATPLYVPAYGFDGFNGFADDRHARRDFRREQHKRHDANTGRVPAVIQRPQRR